MSAARVRSGLQLYLWKQLLSAYWQSRGRTALTPQSCATRGRDEAAGRQVPATGGRRCGHNPFVLVNYSSTICLNPTVLIVGRAPADFGRPREEMRWLGREIPRD